MVSSKERIVFKIFVKDIWKLSKRCPKRFCWR